MKKNYNSCLVLAFFLMSTNVFSQKPKNEIGFKTDNDSYLSNGSDRYYTNGLFLYYRHAINNLKKGNLANAIIGIEIGQKMFTPQSAAISSPKHVDRPFAGYLYIEPHINLLYKNESNLKLSMQIGVTGKLSLAENAQNLVHKILGFYNPNGWQDQVKDHFILNVSAEYNASIYKKRFFDLTLSSKVNMGDGFIGGDTGPVFRVGKFNTLTNSKLTESWISSSTNTSKSYELYFYYHPKIIYNGYDITVQRSIFYGNPTSGQILSVTQPLVYNNQLGIDYSSRHYTIGIAFVIQTKDVKSMLRDYHHWGSFSASYLF